MPQGVSQIHRSLGRRGRTLRPLLAWMLILPMLLFVYMRATHQHESHGLLVDSYETTGQEANASDDCPICLLLIPNLKAYNEGIECLNLERGQKTKYATPQLFPIDPKFHFSLRAPPHI